MPVIPVQEIVLGIYLGLLAGIFPGFIAFSLGFIFKYFTSVTIPGLGVVALSGGLAGVSGGLMGLLDPAIADSWIGIIAVVVILMVCLWAHAIGDKLGAETPRTLTLARLRQSRLSADLVDRVDGYGQLRVRPVGTIRDVEGFPPITPELQAKLMAKSWKFPAGLPLEELERRLRERLFEEFELAEAEVTIDRRGRAWIAAAPAPAGLSRRVPADRLAVTIRTLLPTGVARGDEVELALSDEAVRGTVLSAQTIGAATASDGPAPPADEGDRPDEEDEPPPPRAPTTTGGPGRVTVAVSAGDARRILRHEFAPMVVNSRGNKREYEAVTILKEGGNRLRKLAIGESSELVGRTIGEAGIRDTHGVAILALLRGGEQFVAPDTGIALEPGDEMIIAGKRGAIRSVGEVAG